MAIKRYRYAETLEKKIQKYFNQFGINHVVCTDSFIYLPETKTVCFTIYNYTTDQELIDFINKKYDVDITDWFFIFSLLHEVGHHMTIDEITDDDMIAEIMMRNSILSIFEDENRNEIYFNLPAEDLANRWAIDYISNHEEECWKFQKKCFAIMQHIFNKKSFTY